VLVADGGPGGHLAGVAVRGQSCDLQLRVERVTGVDLAKELAADAGEGDEDVADVLREQGRSGRGEGQHLQAVDDRRDMAVAAGVVDVVVDRMVVGRDCLERRGVGVGQGPAGRPEDVPTLRSSNALGSTTVKAAGSNWSGPEAAGWVIAGAPYVEMEWDNRCLRQRRLPVQRSGHPAGRADRPGGLVIRLTRRWAWGATSTAVGTATTTATAKEVSQAGTRLDVNPSLTIVSTSDTDSDITMAMIAETSSGAYLGSTRRAEALDSPGSARCTSSAACGWRCPRISVAFLTCLNPSRGE